MVDVDYTKIEGFRGNDEINSLVRYIEKTDSGNNSGKSTINKNGGGNSNGNGIVTHLSKLLTTKNEKKTKQTSKKESGNSSASKLKKCNSLEELSSCSKLKEIASSTTVTTHANVISNQQSSTILRSKTSQLSIQHNMITSNTQSNKTSSKSDKNNKSQQKRTERRSWGTEELSYLGENKTLAVLSTSDELNGDSLIFQNIIPNTNMNNQSLKTMALLPSTTTASIVMTTTQTHVVTQTSQQPISQGMISSTSSRCNAKQTQQSNKSNDIDSSEVLVSSLSIESLPRVGLNETTDFLLVTKKKKMKKRNLFTTDERLLGASVANGSKNNYQNRNNTHNNVTRSKYNFTNDRDKGGTDVYNNGKQHHNNNHYHHQHHNQYSAGTHQHNHHQLKNNRRKSTSSVPPSENSDSSDLDSVHSLPIESMVNTGKNEKSSSIAQDKQKIKISGGDGTHISYADIAKIANTSKNRLEGSGDIRNNNNIKWPIINNVEQILASSLSQQQSQEPSPIQQLNNNEFDNEKIVKLNLNNNNNQSSNNNLPINNNCDNKLTSNIEESDGEVSGTRPNQILSQINLMEKNLVLLKKSKSVEIDNYSVPIDQYPALENTMIKAKSSLLNSSCIGGVGLTIGKKQKFPQSSTNVLTMSMKKECKKPNKTTTSQSHSTHPTTMIAIPTATSIISNSTNDDLTCGKNRPAVIILNDNDKTINDITFGFEINKQLLFGDFNDDELYLFDLDSDKTGSLNDQHQHYTNNIKILNNHINNSDVSTISDPGYISITSSSSPTGIESILENSLKVKRKITEMVVSDAISNRSINNDITNDKLEDDTMSSKTSDISILNNKDDSTTKSGNYVKFLVNNNKHTELSICYRAPNLDNVMNDNHEEIVNFIGKGKHYK